MPLIDPRTAASTPGHINASIARLLRFRPWILLPALLTAGLGIAGAVATGNGRIGGGAIVGVVITGGLIRATKAKFASGDLIPGCIISTDPLLIACLTDLSTGTTDQSFHVIAISAAPRSMLSSSGSSVSIGDPCPMCALYRGNMKESRWATFTPDPVWLASGDPATVNRAASRFTESQWAQLSAALDQVPNPPKPGTYRVNLHGTTSGWPSESIGKRV